MSAGETSARLKAKVTERCPWCHHAACRRALSARCDACGTGLHPRCADEARSCPTLGCQGFLMRTPERRARWRPSAWKALGGGALAGLVLLVIADGALRLQPARTAVAGEVVEAPLILSGELDVDPDEVRPRGTDLSELPQERLGRGSLTTYACGPRRVLRSEEDGLEGWRRDQLWRAGQWLAASQGKDGSWGADGRSPVGTTGLVLAALAASGSTHRGGPHRWSVSKGLAWLLEQQQRDGGFGVDHAEDQALATLALALLAEGQRDLGLRSSLERARARLARPSAFRDPSPYDALALGFAERSLSANRSAWGSPPSLDPGLLIGEPDRWATASATVSPGTLEHAAWRASLVVYLHERQHPSGAWTTSGALDGVDLSWVTARNLLALALLGS